MRLFALADLHLSFAQPKPMDIFGPAWHDHAARIERLWRERVQPEDAVLVPGDISWAMKFEAARTDLEWLDRLPGLKVLVKGNHDYWWTGLAHMRRSVPPSIRFVQHDAVLLGDIALSGTRLWQFPECSWPRSAEDDFEMNPASGEARGPVSRTPDPETMRHRESLRLEAALCSLSVPARRRILLTHFPPLGADGQPTPLTRRIAAARVDLCVFGHLHGVSRAPPPAGADVVLDGTRFVFVACDWLDCAPKLVWADPSPRA